MRKGIKSFWKGGSGKPTKSHSDVDLVCPSPSSPVPSDSRSEISFHSAETNNNNAAGESPNRKSSSLLHPRQFFRRAASPSSGRRLSQESTHSLPTSAQQPSPGLNSHSSSTATAPVPLPTATSTDVIANPIDGHGVSAISTTTNKPSSEATLINSNIPNTAPLPNSNDRIEISVQISDCQSPLLWIRTLAIVDKELRKHELPALDRNSFTSTSAADNIQSIIATCTVKADQNDDDPEKTSGRERLKRILRHVDKYTKIVDTAVQHSPEVTSLVWAGIRTILLVWNTPTRFRNIEYMLIFFMADFFKSFDGYRRPGRGNVDDFGEGRDVRVLCQDICGGYITKIEDTSGCSGFSVAKFLCWGYSSFSQNPGVFPS